MVSRLLRRWRAARWAFLGAAVLVLIAFSLAQRQSTEVSFAQSPSSGGLPETSTAGHSDATVPSTSEMTALVEADPVVRLPGSVATWDEDRVAAAIGDADVRILVAPPGLYDAHRDRVRAVENATIRVIGTEVTGGSYESVSKTVPSWRAQYASGDVTGQLVRLIAALTDQPTPPRADPLTWRDPDDRELAAVLPDLHTDGVHIAPGATLTGLPAAASTAFPGRDGRYLALPAQPADVPIPRYGPALAAEFPDTPIVVIYGSWIEYHGPAQAEFADLATTSFYSQFGGQLSRYAYPQDNVLGAYLNQVTDIRYAGLFDQSLPYQPFDPLRVTWPALPWLFTGCVVVFLLLSVRTLRQPGPAGLGSRWRGRPGAPAQLAGLSALAVEMSLLTDRSTDPSLARGVGKLQAARAALDDGLPDRHVRELLADAWDELDAAARTMRMAYFRPGHYLRQWST